MGGKFYGYDVCAKNLYVCANWVDECDKNLLNYNNMMQRIVRRRALQWSVCIIRKRQQLQN